MIQILEGRGVGAGKSYYVVTRIIAHLCNGGTVYYSDTLHLLPDKILALCEKRHGWKIEPDQMVAVPRDEVWRIHEVTPAGTDECPVLIVLDEVQRALNARDWADKSKRALFDWACESRHDSNDLMFISQNALNIDKQVARLATYVTRVRNMANFKIAGMKWPFRQFMVNLFDGDGKTLMEKKLIWQDPAIFACYVSKSMRGSHQRLSGVIGKRKLQKVKGGKFMKFMGVFLIVALILGGGLMAKAYNSGGFACFGAKPAAVGSVPGSTEKPRGVATSGPVAAARPPYVVRRETFRGLSAGILRTDVWQYEKGQMTPGGMCEGVDGYCAKVRSADGQIVYVVAGDGARLPVSVSTLAPGQVVSGTSAPLPVAGVGKSAKRAKPVPEWPDQPPFGGWVEDEVPGTETAEKRPSNVRAKSGQLVRR